MFWCWFFLLVVLFFDVLLECNIVKDSGIFFFVFVIVFFCFDVCFLFFFDFLDVVFFDFNEIDFFFVKVFGRL